MEKVVIYSRVSTEEQAKEGRSVEDQITKCYAEAEKRGYKVLEVFKDPGYSGTTDNRPDLQNMLAYCQECEVDKVLVIDTDRIARSETLHFAIKAMLKKVSTVIESVNQPMIDDSPEGSFMDSIIAAVNAFQPKITARKTRISLEEKAKTGWYPSYAPLGYLNTANPLSSGPLDKNIITPDPERSPYITEAFRLYSTGTYTIESLSKELSGRGFRSRTGNKVGKTIMADMLGSIFYTGKFYWKGNLLNGRHKPLIDDTTYNKCQMILAGHNHYADRKRKHTFLLTDSITCGICGSKYTAEKNLKRGINYYHCPVNKVKHSNVGQNVEAGELEKQVEHYFKYVKLTSSMVERTLKEAELQLQKTYSGSDEKKRVLSLREQKLEDQRQALEISYLDRSVTKETYLRQSERIENELLDIAKEKNRLFDDRTTNIGVFRQFMLLAQDVQSAYKKATPELKQKYVALFWEQIIAKDKKIIEAKPTIALRAALGIDSIKLINDKPVVIKSSDPRSSIFSNLRVEFRTMKVAVHNGRFHADDVFSVATLKLAEVATEVIRTRDVAKLESSDLRVDVGRKNNPASGDYDHHQVGGAGKRQDGIPYASFGLIWKNYGGKACSSDEVAQKVDERLVRLVDADDIGFDLFKTKDADIRQFDVSRVITNFNPTWHVDPTDEQMDQLFFQAVDLALVVLKKEIEHARASVEAAQIVKGAIKKMENLHIIVLDHYMPWKETVITEAPDAWYVVFPTWPAVRNQWSVYTVTTSLDSFESRKKLPSAWAGKEGQALIEATGVKDAAFCHSSGFVIIAESKEGALKLAELAVQSKED